MAGLGFLVLPPSSLTNFPTWCGSTGNSVNTSYTCAGFPTVNHLNCQECFQESHSTCPVKEVEQKLRTYSEKSQNYCFSPQNSQEECKSYSSSPQENSGIWIQPQSESSCNLRHSESEGSGMWSRAYSCESRIEEMPVSQTCPTRWSCSQVDEGVFWNSSRSVSPSSSGIFSPPPLQQEVTCSSSVFSPPPPRESFQSNGEYYRACVQYDR